jgi:hypothetical protein
MSHVFGTVYGVFARKTIPKRTQFGPIEGVLVKTDDPHMILADREESQLELLVESETGAMLKLDTGCESKCQVAYNVLIVKCYSCRIVCDIDVP